MPKVKFDLLDVGYVELKLSEIQKLLWESINYVQGFPVVQAECEAAIYELEMQKEALGDDPQVEQKIKSERYNLERNKRKLEQQVGYIDYFQKRIKEVKKILKDGKDFEVVGVELGK